MTGILIWITGLSGSGKTTIAKLVYAKHKINNPATIHLDGDDFREILGNDLNHNSQDRLKNAFRIAKMCSFLTSQGIDVICSTISLYKEIHDFNRLNNNKYFEIYLEVDQQELIDRDPKGLYKKALNGEINNIVGINLKFDKPINCNLIIKNNKSNNLEQSANKILKIITEGKGYNEKD